MRIIFAGTPDFAVYHLQALIDSEHEIIAVYTQPDKPKGRGLKMLPSPVKQLVMNSSIPIKQPKDFRDESTLKELQELAADLMVVVAYGLLLPPALLTAPKWGCVNVHASLLPRWRGAAPIQHAILAGDQTTGITIMQMDKGLDTGNILLKESCHIAANDTAATLHDRLAELGPPVLLSALRLIAAGETQFEQQDNAQSTYAHKLTKAQAQIDWTLPAKIIDQQVRGLNPWPVAVTYYQQQLIRVWQVALTDRVVATAKPGEIVAIDKKALYVATGDEMIRLDKIQLAGSKAMSVAEILNGNKISFQRGDCFSNEN